MSRLIKKYQNPNSSIDYWSQFKSKDINGKRYYQFIDPIEGTMKYVDPNNSKIFDNGRRGYAYLNDNFEPSGRYTAISGDPNVGGISQQDVELQHLYDRYNADQTAERLTGGLENYVTPWGIAGTTFNTGMGQLMSILPESAQKALSNLRYIDPAYGIDVLSGLSDEQILNGEGLTGTPTGTAFSLFTAPTLYNKAYKGLRATPYVIGKYGGNTALGNWGRGYTVSRIMDNSVNDLYNPGALYSATYQPLEDPKSMFPIYRNRTTGQYVEPPAIQRVSVDAADDFMMGERTFPTTYIPARGRINPDISIPNTNDLSLLRLINRMDALGLSRDQQISLLNNARRRGFLVAQNNAGRQFYRLSGMEALNEMERQIRNLRNMNISREEPVRIQNQPNPIVEEVVPTVEETVPVVEETAPVVEEVIEQSTEPYQRRLARRHVDGTPNMFNNREFGRLPMREDVLARQLENNGITNLTQQQVTEFLNRNNLSQGYAENGGIDIPLIFSRNPEDMISARTELMGKIGNQSPYHGGTLADLDHDASLEIYRQAEREAGWRYGRPIEQQPVRPIEQQSARLPIQEGIQEQTMRPIEQQPISLVQQQPLDYSFPYSMPEEVKTYLTESQYKPSGYLNDDLSGFLKDVGIESGVPFNIDELPINTRKYIKELAEEGSKVNVYELLVRGGVDPNIAKDFAARNTLIQKSISLAAISDIKNMLKKRGVSPNKIKEITDKLLEISERNVEKKTFSPYGANGYIESVKRRLQDNHRTKLPSETPYTLEEVRNMFDSDGSLKSEWNALDRLRSGSHGQENWDNNGFGGTSSLRKHLSARFPENNRNNLDIMTENFDGSGVYIGEQSGHFSLDSSRLLMGMLARRLGNRNIYRPEGLPASKSRLNGFGVVNKYSADLNPEVIREIKNNRDIINRMTVSRDGDIILDGRVVGKFGEKTSEEILAELNRSADLVNRVLRNKYIKNGITAEEELAKQYYVNPFTYDGRYYYLPDNIEGAVVYKSGGKTKRLIKKPNLKKV